MARTDILALALLFCLPFDVFANPVSYGPACKNKDPLLTLLQKPLYKIIALPFCEAYLGLIQTKVVTGYVTKTYSTSQTVTISTAAPGPEVQRGRRDVAIPATTGEASLDKRGGVAIPGFIPRTCVAKSISSACSCLAGTKTKTYTITKKATTSITTTSTQTSTVLPKTVIQISIMQRRKRQTNTGYAIWANNAVVMARPNTTPTNPLQFTVDQNNKLSFVIPNVGLCYTYADASAAMTGSFWICTADPNNGIQQYFQFASGGGLLWKNPAFSATSQLARLCAAAMNSDGTTPLYWQFGNTGTPGCADASAAVAYLYPDGTVSYPTTSSPALPPAATSSTGTSSSKVVISSPTASTVTKPPRTTSSKTSTSNLPSTSFFTSTSTKSTSTTTTTTSSTIQVQTNISGFNTFADQQFPFTNIINADNAQDLTDCINRLCVPVSTCVGVTYNYQNNGICYTLSAADTTQLTAQPGAQAAIYPGPRPISYRNYITYPGYVFPNAFSLADQGAYQASSLADCLDTYCSTVDACTAASFTSSSGTGGICYLMSSTDVSKLVKSTGSYPASDGYGVKQPLPESTRVYRDFEVYEGYTIADSAISAGSFNSDYADSANACVDMCLNATGCQAAVYRGPKDGERGICYLMSAQTSRADLIKSTSATAAQDAYVSSGAG